MKLLNTLFLFVFCLFAAAEAQALIAPISAADACRQASSSYERQCISQLRADYYYDEYAAAACASASSSYIPNCVSSIANHYFQKEAASSCSSASSSYVQGCLSAVAGKRFTSGVVASCGGQSSSNMASCYRQSPFTPVTPPIKKTPVFEFCNDFSTANLSVCTGIVQNLGGATMFDEWAIGVCAILKGDEEVKLNCLESIGGLSFASKDQVETCGENYNDPVRAISCLKLSGVSIIDEEEGIGEGVCFVGERELFWLLDHTEDAQRLVQDGNVRRVVRKLRRLSRSIKDCIIGRPIFNGNSESEVEGDLE